MRRGLIERAGGRPDLLVSPVLALCVASLVLNDHVLKATWPGIVTGKLSDVAGVAMIAITVAALSGRPRGTIVATAVAFALLKTVDAVALAASPVLGGVTLTDPTDLVALLVLVPIWRWLATAPPVEPRRTSWWIAPLKVASLSAVAVATSATSCATDEVFSVDTVGREIVATTDDGTFASRDGGVTWQSAPDLPYDSTRDGRLQSVCLSDGTCFEIADAAVTRTADGDSTTDFSLSTEQTDALSKSNPNDCGGSSTRFGSIAAVELDDGAHVVVALGPHGAMHRSPDGTWEWTVIGDYGRDNPLAPS